MAAATPGRRPRSPLAVIFLTVFIDLLGFGIVLPLLPVYSQAYGASELELGLLFSSFSGMQFLFAPLWGRLSDKIGRRPVLLGGLLGTSASYALFALADSMPMLFVSRLLAGFFGANVSTALAYIADVTTPENRAKGMGLVGAAFGLGFTFGPLIGGELTRFSPRYPGWFAAGLSLCAAAYGWSRLVEPERSRSASRVFGFSQVRRALGEARIGVLLLLSFLSIMAFSSFEAMFARFGLAVFPAQFGVSGAVEHASRAELLAAAPITGRYLCIVGILSAIIQGGVIRPLVPRFGEPTLAFAGQAILGLALLVLGLSTSWTMVVVGCLLLPLGFGLNNPSLTGLISRASPVDEQGAYLGLNQSIASLARMSGPPIAGWLFHAVGPHSPFLAGAVVLGLAAVLAFVYRARYGASFTRPTRREPASGGAPGS